MYELLRQSTISVDRIHKHVDMAFCKRAANPLEALAVKAGRDGYRRQARAPPRPESIAPTRHGSRTPPPSPQHPPEASPGAGAPRTPPQEGRVVGARGMTKRRENVELQGDVGGETSLARVMAENARLVAQHNDDQDTIAELRAEIARLREVLDRSRHARSRSRSAFTSLMEGYLDFAKRAAAPRPTASGRKISGLRRGTRRARPEDQVESWATMFVSVRRNRLLLFRTDTDTVATHVWPASSLNVFRSGKRLNSPYTIALLLENRDVYYLRTHTSISFLNWLAVLTALVHGDTPSPIVKAGTHAYTALEEACAHREGSFFYLSRDAQRIASASRKRPGRRSAWLACHLVLWRRRLFVFADRQSIRPDQSIDVVGYSVHPPEGPVSRENCVQLTHPGLPSVCLAFDTPEEAAHWTRDLTTAAELLDLVADARTHAGSDVLVVASAVAAASTASPPASDRRVRFNLAAAGTEGEREGGEGGGGAAGGGAAGGEEAGGEAGEEAGEEAGGEEKREEKREERGGRGGEDEREAPPPAPPMTLAQRLQAHVDHHSQQQRPSQATRNFSAPTMSTHMLNVFVDKRNNKRDSQMCLDDVFDLLRDFHGKPPREDSTDDDYDADGGDYDDDYDYGEDSASYDQVSVSSEDSDIEGASSGSTEVLTSDDESDDESDDDAGASSGGSTVVADND